MTRVRDGITMAMDHLWAASGDLSRMANGSQGWRQARVLQRTVNQATWGLTGRAARRSTDAAMEEARRDAP